MINQIIKTILLLKVNEHLEVVARANGTAISLNSRDSRGT